ncbi:glycerol-3-phosphate 1-O-acyltransferase PlsY [Parvicella tangerina]|uniref:Glycerol-3-phosphate acyltransferase n=1 Tax=Parvicella tangerina TaxID=2829795 RepID=A0A916NI53_9FLAO|nr:glycerol-3-phosphate 1-O-acyltransferase PlsY [Parvicella tangerina]CAG5084447.1 putative glycerol-3-phosphate acyltransferase [Parvicella tangerina]
MKEVFEFNNILAIILAYLIGSIPSAIWVSKWFFGIDVRDYGSKNAGATNTFRVIGKKAGFPVLFFDILKGWASVTFLSMLSSYELGSNQHINLQLAVGLAAVFGHVYPIYERFKGGKGVATLLGIVLAINFPAAGVSFILFLLTYIISQYVSLGAITAAFFFPFITVYVFKATSPTLIYFSVVISFLVIFTHRKNIERLLKKKENKMPLNIRNKR